MTTDTKASAAVAALDAGFAAALLRTSQAVLHVLTEVSRTYDLTQQQAQLMCALLDGPVGMTELSRQLHLDKSSVTGLVARIERRGLVERLSDPADRRTSRIALTGEGRTICNSAYVEVAARLEELAADVPAARREQAVSVLAAMFTP